MKRFKIRNSHDGRKFIVQDGREEIGALQPEWGLNPEVVIEDITAEWENRQINLARQKEYPPVEDFLDAYVKLSQGNNAQMDKYIADYLEVKRRHPKKGS